MRRVTLISEIKFFDSDEKQVISTQIHTVFVADGSISDTDSDSTITQQAYGY